MVKCPNINHKSYGVRFYQFLQGNRCKECYLDEFKYSYEYVKNYIESYGYILLSETYIGVHSYLNIQCPENHKYEITFANFNQGNRCKECNVQNQRISFEEIKIFVERTGNKLLSTTYINNMSLLKIECGKCQKQFERSFKGYRKYSGCPSCSSGSCGENLIENHLRSINFNPEKQHTFQDCKYINVLKFDFYIPVIRLGIEFFDKKSSLEIRQKRDDVKVKYCENNNITLLVIPYWDIDNIPTILNNTIARFAFQQYIKMFMR